MLLWRQDPRNYCKGLFHTNVDAPKHNHRTRALKRLGDFERSKGLLAREVLDTEVTAETLLAQGVTRAWRLDDQELDEPQGVVTAVETAQKAMNRATGVWVVVASVLALL